MSANNSLLKNCLPLLFLILYSSALILTDLGGSALQVDEGADTWVSSTILKFGVPRHSDGVNRTMEYADIYDGLFIYRTWVPYYLQAFSLAIFEDKTFAARLPFALTGIASVIGLYFLSLKLTRNRTTAFLSALFLASSVPALLYFRTARYPGLPILLTLLLLYFYYDIFKENKWRSGPFTATAIIFFHTMYVECAGVLVGILVHLMAHRDGVTKENFRKVLPAAGMIALFTLPWLFFIAPVFPKIAEFYQSASSHVDSSSAGYLKRFAGYLFQINNYVFPLVLLPLLWVRNFQTLRREVQLLCLCALSILMAGSLHMVPLQQYITALFPILCILLALIVVELCQNRVWIQGLMAGTLIATNLIHVSPLLPVRALLEANSERFEKGYLHSVYNTFIREIRLSSVFYQHGYQLTHPAKGPQDIVVSFFKTHGKVGDSCYSDNERESLAFYTGMRILHKKDLSDGAIPDWIVLRGDKRYLDQKASVSDEAAMLRNILDAHTYRKIELPGSVNRINNSYDIQLHLFQIPSSADTILIYEKSPESADSSNLNSTAP